MKRENIPSEIKETTAFKYLRPSSATCMVRKIINNVRHFPKEILRFEDDVPGARMWEVALGKSMMTYFEVQPHSQFEMHIHESEQITMVLEGELFFEVAGKTMPVKKGEVIAIPSYIPHAVYTEGLPVKAVDAWSPVMEKIKATIL